jgi:hypothetical protein
MQSESLSRSSSSPPSSSAPRFHFDSSIYHLVSIPPRDVSYLSRFLSAPPENFHLTRHSASSLSLIFPSSHSSSLPCPYPAISLLRLNFPLSEFSSLISLLPSVLHIQTDNQRLIFIHENESSLFVNRAKSVGISIHLPAPPSLSFSSNYSLFSGSDIDQEIQASSSIPSLIHSQSAPPHGPSSSSSVHPPGSSTPYSIVLYDDFDSSHHSSLYPYSQLDSSVFHSNSHGINKKTSSYSFFPDDKEEILPPSNSLLTSLSRSISASTANSRSSEDYDVPNKSQPTIDESTSNSPSYSASPSLSHCSSDPLAIELTPFWHPALSDRQRVSALLKALPHHSFLFRPCGDPSERVANQPWPNPNLFVLSFVGSEKLGNLKVWRIPGRGLTQFRDHSQVLPSINSFLKSVFGHDAKPVLREDVA